MPCVVLVAKCVSHCGVCVGNAVLRSTNKCINLWTWRLVNNSYNKKIHYSSATIYLPHNSPSVNCCSEARVINSERIRLSAWKDSMFIRKGYLQKPRIARLLLSSSHHWFLGQIQYRGLFNRRRWRILWHLRKMNITVERTALEVCVVRRGEKGNEKKERSEKIKTWPSKPAYFWFPPPLPPDVKFPHFIAHFSAAVQKIYPRCFILTNLPPS